MDDFLAVQTQTGWGQVLQSFAEWCRVETGWTVLDVGCGPGLFPALLAQRGCRAVGLDLEGSVLRAGKLHPALVEGNVFALPFPSRAFEFVTASNLLFLLPDPQRALLEMMRVLKPGGQVAVLNPSEKMSQSAAQALADQRQLSGVARQSLLGWASRAEAHHRWTERDLEQLFHPVGLRLTETSLRIGPGLARYARAVLYDPRKEPPFLA